jgi:hypothetical protein
MSKSEWLLPVFFIEFVTKGMLWHFAERGQRM